MDLNKLLRTLDTINEGSMKSAEKHKTGPKFTGHWKGTDKSTPGTKLVGEDDSVIRELDREGKKRTLEWALQEEYEKFVAEYGMTTGGMVSAGGTTDANNAAQKTQQLATAQKNNANIQKSLQSIKSVTPDVNVAKTATALTKADTEQDLTSMDKDASAALAEPIGDIAKDPQLAGQFKQLVQKAQQKDMMQQKTQQGTV